MQKRVQVIGDSGILGGDARGVACSPKTLQDRINSALARFPTANLLDIRLTSYATPVSSDSNPNMGSVLAVVAVLTYEMDDETAAKFDTYAKSEK